MKKPGRKSDGLGITALPDNVAYLATGSLKPPAELTEAQGAIWTEMVAAKPPGWFGKDSAAMLVNYCIAIERRRWVSARIEEQLKLRYPKFVRLQALYEMERRQSSTISSLSTKMRLTQQARYTPAAAETATKTAPDMRKPWESVN